LDELKKYFKKDRYADLAGIELLEIKEGYAKARMKIEEKHHNAMRSVHGGALFTLADFVFAVAANSYGTVAVAINTSMSFFKGIAEGIVTAESREISLHHKISSYNIDIRDEKNELIASFQGMAYRKNEPLQL
jgi:acyl-CoA thioesterase